MREATATTTRWMAVGLASSVALIVGLTVRTTSRSLAPPRAVEPLDCLPFRLKTARTQIAEHMRRAKLDDSPPGAPLMVFDARRASEQRAHLRACGASPEVALCFGFDPRRAETDIELLTGYQPAKQDLVPNWERKLRFVRRELALCGGAR